MKVIFLTETTSTNDEVRHLATDCDDDVLACYTDYQTAGRGQKGNSWESERGQNLLCSLMMRNVDVMAREQFRISEAVSMGIIEAVRDLSGVECTIKWPNDIYVGDKKLSGILIENHLKGNRISECVVGIGINLNQTVFVSDAPNPVSLRQLTGGMYSAEVMLKHITHCMEEWLHRDASILSEHYHASLYRRDGYYDYYDAEGVFQARIHHVDPHGLLVLERMNGELKQYAFKEVSFLIANS